jgi:hypothetical protein
MTAPIPRRRRLHRPLATLALLLPSWLGAQGREVSPIVAVERATAVAGVATTSVDGRVVADGGAPLADVLVDLAGANQRTHTDAEGRFRFPAAPVGDYLLRLRKAGYQAGEWGVRVATDTAVAIELALAPLPARGSAAQRRAREGFGWDSLFWAEYERRRAQAGPRAVYINRLWLDDKGKVDLFVALRETPARVALQEMAGLARCTMLIDPRRPSVGRLEGNPRIPVFADEVELIELYPLGQEVSGTITQRTTCTMAGRGPAFIVLWLRR